MKLYEKHLMKEKSDCLMTESKKDLEYVGNLVSSDGLGYAIQSGIGYKNIKDKKLASLWKQASDIMDEIEKYLEDYTFEM